MRRLLIAIFAFVLIASPFMAHHASEEAVHDQNVLASQEVQVVASSQCESGCDIGLQEMCCSQAITHCSPTSNYNEAWMDVAPVSTANTYFYGRQDFLVSVTFEADTPPPRV